MKLAINLLKAPHIGIRDLKGHLSEFLKKEKPVVVTDRGQPINVILPYEEMLELLDILDEMDDEETKKTIEEGRKSIRRGEAGIPVSNLFKQVRSKRK